MPNRSTTDLMPGIIRGTVSVDNEYVLAGRENALFRVVQIVSTAVDTGSTPTTRLRKGLVLGRNISTGKYLEYLNNATNGNQLAKGILDEEMSMLDADAAVEDKWARILIPCSVLIDQAKLYGIDVPGRSDLAPIQWVDDF